MTVLIYLTTAGAGTGPFNLYSNLDGYVTPFETGVAKASLTTLPGYTTALVPDGTTTIRVQSTGACTNYIDIIIGATTTTTTTSGALTTTTTASPTSTTTTTLTPAECGEFSLEGGVSGRTFNYTNCDGIPQTTIVNAGDTTSDCIQLPYVAAGATYLAPCGSSTLSFMYIGGDNTSINGTFLFSLSNPLPSNITITGASVSTYNDGTSCITVVSTPTQSGSATITAGNTNASATSSSTICAGTYSRTNAIIVNGNALVNGDTINIGGVTLNISIPASCAIMPCVS
jgi:hypothetical protein